MDKVTRQAWELLQRAFDDASARRWEEVKRADNQLDRLTLLSEEDASGAARRRLLAIIGSEDK